ncbi:MAG: protein phosphatase 2C domain-containing protein, partial [Rhizomicrobium sp.]
MTLGVLELLSLPGDPAKANEDAFGHDADAAVVIDGATPLGESLMPGPSDAAWIAQFGARRLMAHLKDGDGARKALRATLGDTQRSFEALRRHAPEEMWQTPCASMMLVATGEGELEFLWYGDCAALIKQGEAPVIVVGETFDKRAVEAKRAQTLAKEKNLSPAAGLSRAEFIGSLRASRNRINSGNNWLFSPDVKAAAHVSRRVMKVRPGSEILLLSDGFLALATDYGAYNVDSLMAAALAKGLAALGKELRAIEADDSGGDKFP